MLMVASLIAGGGLGGGLEGEDSALGEASRKVRGLRKKMMGKTGSRETMSVGETGMRRVPSDRTKGRGWDVKGPHGAWSAGLPDPWAPRVMRRGRVGAMGAGEQGEKP
jgi:hypothetical protein